MDSFVIWREGERQPDTPPLVLELNGNTTIWSESEDNFYFLASLQRLIGGENNTDANQPCWLHWSPIVDPGRGVFILLHHDPESDSRERIGIEERPVYPLELGIKQFPHEPPSCYTAEAQASYDRYQVTHRLHFPESWAKLLQPEKIDRWGWGTSPEEGNGIAEPKEPPVLIPGGAHITFTVVEGKRPPFPRPASPPPIQASERVPGAPVLSLELSCSPTVALTGLVEVSIKVTYHGVADRVDAINENAQPITFHTQAFCSVDGGFRLYRRRHAEGRSEETWEPCYDSSCQFGMWDNPDRLVNVSENRDGRFQTLFPGESWSDSWRMCADGEAMLDDIKLSDTFRYQFKGGTLDW
ncbi:hypothetical protein ASPZODRAFT_170166 [Penicilliopsis zonata CBS 506.65]|uniref:Uncharacterized protein n=1 Tax=Penicilliopsis zonata CBS 506.65 TaxID=1073090 RepID=A0A1L9S5R8_9EURO|nr:hypothetical protein ASPZODRAFT_170166 [Penicilliopsis zonata CBS 506.65]OJJ42512.1 hypothetical protein ASPZODRAFT_170166 [Penicilliopsis zonata CBS 506.65]